MNASKQPNDDPWSPDAHVVSKSITIGATPGHVWETLTNVAAMKVWMLPSDIEIATDWGVGSPIRMRGRFNGARFENRGTVLQFEPDRVLRYSQWSSLSRIPDIPTNHSVLEFRLSALPDGQTELTVSVSHFPNEGIYKHLQFYWNVTPEVIKRKVESAG